MNLPKLALGTAPTALALCLLHPANLSFSSPDTPALLLLLIDGDGDGDDIVVVVIVIDGYGDGVALCLLHPAI